MRLVIYEDKDGWKCGSMIRDDDPDNYAPKGLPKNPPDLRDLDWDGIMREINNALVDRELFTWRDVQLSQNGITSIVNNIVRRKIVALYKYYDSREKKEA
jgi:hypothetical protein